jgi:hypothetical protein
MAQHDYVIANQGFPAFRSDLNNALAAIVSNNSGATEPSTTFAHQLWVDTAADPSILKIRNADNDAFITIGEIDQTGDKFNLKCANATILENLTLNAQGDLRFADSDSSNYIAFQAPATVATNVTFTLPAADGTSGQAIQTDGSGTLSFATIAASPGGSTTQVQFNNAGSFGGISGVTTDGTRMTASTTIGVGGATPSTSGSGISFPATQSASSDANTMDDYEEGSWTPNVQGSSTAGTTTYYSGGRGGRYVKIGKLVWLRFYANYSAATGTGNFNITGLPFAVADAGLGTTMTDGLNWTGGTMQTLFINAGDTAMRLFGSADDTGWSVCQLSNENVDMQGTIIYESS